ncbi:MAG: D-2-hydroxyacid dehydrogenase [Erysipelotrichaceae bacterium]|nr:D-2-hydroxyacid dehydrogenase [Erysipelotrichaceae bacterium]
MKKVFVNIKADEKYRQRLEAISDRYEFVYEPDPDANIILGNYAPGKLKEFKNLEWIQTAAVGVDAFIKDGNLKEGVILTNAVDVHSVEVAEHLFAMIMSMTRKFYLYRDDQKEHLWADEGMTKELTKLRVAVIGFGDIGKALAKLLKGIGIHVIGVKRTMIEKPDCLDELYTDKDLDKAISDADAVVSILPGNRDNAYLFTVDTFRKMRPDAIFINAGRGNLCSTETIREVLDQHIIAAISLDVFEEEPLPKDSPLWDYRNLVITPHVAGSYRLESTYEKFFALAEENLRRYISGQQLLHVVKERE